ncbi:TetR/AcrR family transcriptional regulator [Streptomyces sp. XD-27]|uniref:TetR/AcrR family transcriptional regulator n=1 Tax=Streptomyces sp. XD-27 TaxID=3062779 RepID=UPI0026F4512F|nr:TetR/AcrR family transcriptional regulator [Streptomyces sp. XD-27]WKX72777.1 helix-turn-helix domain-containing protein [Streptomyces sp. XD-27]
MRADAQRNREKLLRAAREVFVDLGPDAPLEEIAQRAGVGIATLYRRFPERAALIAAVATDVLTALGRAAWSALSEETDPAEGLRRYAHAALDLKVGAVMPALSGRFDLDEVLDGVHGDAVDAVQEMLTRAQRAGLIRDDAAFGDISLMIVRLSRPLPGGVVPYDDALAHRQLDLYLDGLRAPGADRPAGGPPGPAIDADGFKALRSRIAGSSATDRGPDA